MSPGLGKPRPPLIRRSHSPRGSPGPFCASSSAGRPCAGHRRPWGPGMTLERTSEDFHGGARPTPPGAASAQQWGCRPRQEPARASLRQCPLGPARSQPVCSRGCRHSVLCPESPSRGSRSQDGFPVVRRLLRVLPGAGTGGRGGCWEPGGGASGSARPEGQRGGLRGAGVRRGKC